MMFSLCFCADGTRSVHWERKGTGGIGSDLLGAGYCWGNSVESVLCLESCLYFLDLADVGTWGENLFCFVVCMNTPHRQFWA